ncbi:MAG: hypothetical protein SFU86_08275 [Pirellulaceae bacterium]|nr:hypothetical protein [Pirellulaceae bacterium]
MFRQLLALTLVLVVASPRLPADETEPAAKVWEGTWMNRKYNSSGPLRCEAKAKDDGTAEATFSGTFMRDPFQYDVTVSTKQERSQMTLTGTATLDGDRYEWSGFVRGKLLYGQFRSLKGHNGEFRLQEVEPK